MYYTVTYVDDAANVLKDRLNIYLPDKQEFEVLSEGSSSTYIRRRAFARNVGFVFIV